MSQIELNAADGHTLTAHLAQPEGEPRGGLVVVQEIFGVNDHIRDVTDRFAAEGYRAVAPALFDRIRPGIELGYEPENIDEGRALVGELDPDELLRDLAAAVEHVSAAGKVGTVGYCFGGAVVWVMAGRLDGLSCAVSYYGSRIPRYAELAPKVPVLMHVGRRDASFPIETVREIAGRYEDVEHHEYDADHGFNCDRRGSYDAPSAATALQRTLGFFRQHVG
ncbi:MAG TPA: dienelactone hydrolase family protein [Sandaracinaceae bacterium LLY-WYZ-13_1]|nr:dienelactone hydrolase family protein [Sandaracinaceae bacterium LLY-WYZ-13_1]